MTGIHSNDTSKAKLAFLCFAALGVVYGDIGTSPLYAINEMFFGHKGLAVNPENILGSISLIVWAITIVISFKYVVYVLRADNDGEGGIFALFGLLDKIVGKKSVLLITPLLIFAAGLLFGDGMITPAISVVSAVEGLKVITTSFEKLIVPISIVIITGLFLIQRKGTAKVGKVFGPIITIWFITIGAIGLSQVLNNTKILMAFNPLKAIKFLIDTPFHEILVVLGSVMLAITGGEAMYADMGHFGRKPIRLSWFSLVYPALLLNYLGQGAFLLGNGNVIQNNIFYSMAPVWSLIPLVILATMATIIASQALISGAFSLASQGISLGLFPMLKEVHTHREHEGQIYVPSINWLLLLGCISIVLIFQTSTRLAGAYGLAVSGVMLMTSLAMMGVARYYWKWNKLKVYLIFVPLALIDGTFLFSNLLKLFEGGFIPVLIGLAFLAFMQTWRWGRKEIRREIERSYSSMTMLKLIEIKKKETHFFPRSIVILSPTPVDKVTDQIPALKQIFWERYGMLPKHLILLTVKTNKVPYIHKDRHHVTSFYDDPVKGSITGVRINYGFMETPNIEKELIAIAQHEHVNIDEHPSKWLIHIMRERIFPSRHLRGFKKIKMAFFRFLLNNSKRTDHFLGLGKKARVTMEVIPVTLT